MNKKTQRTNKSSVFLLVVLPCLCIIFLVFRSKIFKSSPRKSDLQAKLSELTVNLSEFESSPSSFVIASQMPTPSKIQVPAFSKYKGFSIAIGSGWSTIQTQMNGNPVITISNGQYTIEISQELSTTQTCKYSGESTLNASEIFQNPVELFGISKIYRRALITDKLPGSKHVHIICEKKSDQYETPTSIGKISYITPVQPSDSELLMMDVMLASIK